MRQRPDRIALLAVGALTVLAVVLRVLKIGDSTWGDELYLYEIVHDHGLGEALSIVRDTESTPPLSFVATWVAARIGENDFLWIRLPSLLFSAATVPVIYALGARTAGRTAGLIGALLFVLVPFDIFYGTEGRGYAAVMLFCAASTLSLVELVRTGDRRWVVALALTTAAAAYTHYLVVFVLVAQLAWALVAHRSKIAPVLAGYAGAALLFVPWIPGALEQFDDNTSERVVGLEGAREMLEGVFRAWFGHPFAAPAEIPGRVASVAIVAGLVVAVAFLVHAAIARRTRPSPNLVLVVLLAVATPAAAVLYELGSNTIFLPKYFSASVPAAVIAAGALLAASRRAAVVAVATVLVVAGVAAGTVRSLGPDGDRPNYRAVAEELDRIAPPGAPVVELSIYVGPPGRHLPYFFEREHPYYGEQSSKTPVYGQGRRAGRVYVVVPRGGEAGFVPFLELEQRGFERIARREWPATEPLVLLTYAPAGRS